MIRQIFQKMAILMCMNLSVLLPVKPVFSLESFSSPRFNSMQSNLHDDRYTVFNERLQPLYELRAGEKSLGLYSRSNGALIETFSQNSNPYSRFDVDYRVFVEDEEIPHRHVGIADEKLYDLDSGERIVIEPKVKSGSSLGDVLTTISFSDIPSSATFCDYAYYFKNLDPTSGFADNTNGTCCLISMQILFGYYDAVFHEDLIENLYDVHMSYAALLCRLFPYSPTSSDAFHSYLINLCNSYCGVDIEADGSLSWINQNHLINFYVGAVRNLDYTNNASEGNLSDIITGHHINVVVDGIDAGRPVILNNLSHSTVAFAYDSTYAYLMTGWREESAMAKMKWSDFVGNIFNNYPSAYDLILECEHECTHGYYSYAASRYLCPICGD